MKRRMVGIIISILVVSCSLTEITPPRIVSWLPGEGSNVRERGDFFVIVEWNKPIDETTFEDGFSLISESGVSLKGKFEWLDEKRVKWEPTGEVVVGEMYKISIIGVKDKNGNPITTPFRSYFFYQTEIVTPRIVETFPTNNTVQGVSVHSFLKVVFSSSMDTNSVQKAFSLTPFIRGVFEWEDNNTVMKYLPLESFQGGVNYVAKIGKEARSLTGKKMPGDYEWCFVPGDSLEPLVFAGAFVDENRLEEITNNCHGIEKTMKGIYLLFNKKVNILSLKNALEFEPSLNFAVEPRTNDTNLYYVYWDTSLLSETNYVFRVKKSVVSEDGYTLSNETEMMFFTDGPHSLRPWVKELRLTGDVVMNQLLNSDQINYLFLSTNWTNKKVLVEIEFVSGPKPIKYTSLLNGNLKIEMLPLDARNPSLGGDIVLLTRDSVYSNHFMVYLDNVGASNYYRFRIGEEVMDENSNKIQSAKEYYFYLALTN